jgi:predicted ribosomally synthesized peptide with nif11-like leader
MSKMQEIYNKVVGDQALQEKVSSILKEAESTDQVATEEKFLAFAKELGYEISLEELKSFFDGMYTQAAGELSDAELDQVAGGKVQPDKVLASVFSVGVICAIGSIVDAIRGNCEEFFHRETNNSGSGRP